MEPNDELCLCFHVSRRKVENFVRIEKPRRVGQLAECFGAGTGCGWCRPFLEKIFDAAGAEGVTLPTSDQYADARAGYIREGKGEAPADGLDAG